MGALIFSLMPRVPEEAFTCKQPLCTHDKVYMAYTRLLGPIRPPAKVGVIKLTIAAIGGVVLGRAAAISDMDLHYSCSLGL